MNQGQQDPHAPESQPTRQGRRLIRMLFRSTAEDVKAANGDTPEHDSRAEDATAWKHAVNLQDNSAVPAPTTAEGDNNWRSSGRRTLIDDDDDRDLESAVEALDLESSIADKTLEEMRKAIDDLRAWKESRDQETQEALSKIKAEKAQLHRATPAEDPTTCDDHLVEQLELKHQRQQRDREAQTLELRKEAEAYQLERTAFRTALDESEATRVEQALQDNSDSEGLALSRLRNELFQLNVKQRQEALLKELQTDDNELDMNIVDVQAFTGELDAILAQFDSVSDLQVDQVDS
ncbi:Dipeptidyl peptidase 8 [Phytophthora cinnamomi]|uniref:Dipeptidyl peptidase 8 n=1 Tax=Phytophthora cinnamomi TaxID=4785 RepID=UPI00355AAB02|nr:Dipeptidyl peptidase 8 [Phytophthora cinnamomi]